MDIWSQLREDAALYRVSPWVQTAVISTAVKMLGRNPYRMAGIFSSAGTVQQPYVGFDSNTSDQNGIMIGNGTGYLILDRRTLPGIVQGEFWMFNAGGAGSVMTATELVLNLGSPVEDRVEELLARILATQQATADPAFFQQWKRSYDDWLAQQRG